MLTYFLRDVFLKYVKLTFPNGIETHFKDILAENGELYFHMMGRKEL